MKSKKFFNLMSAILFVSAVFSQSIVNNSVGIDTRIEKENLIKHISAKTVINRRDFGVNYQHQSVPNFVGDNIEVELNLITKVNKL